MGSYPEISIRKVFVTIINLTHVRKTYACANPRDLLAPYVDGSVIKDIAMNHFGFNWSMDKEFYY